MVKGYNRNVSMFKMFHLIWAVISVIKLHKFVENAVKLLGWNYFNQVIFNQGFCFSLLEQSLL